MLGDGDSVRPRARWFVGTRRSRLQHAVAASSGEEGGRSVWRADGKHGAMLGVTDRQRSPIPGEAGGSRAVFALRMGWQIHPRERTAVTCRETAVGSAPRPRALARARGSESICERENGATPTRNPAEGDCRMDPPACFDGREGGFMPPSRKVDG